MKQEFFLSIKMNKKSRLYFVAAFFFSWNARSPIIKCPLIKYEIYEIEN